MSAPSTARNIISALLLSLVAAIFLAVIYALYPVISAIVSGLFSSRTGAGSGGIGAVACWVGESFLLVILVAEPVLFLITFALLQRRRGLH
jgi:Na+/citrate or Na+/malate symporter